MKKIGILTGGADCPGLNSVIRAVVRKSIEEGFVVTGVKNGWDGLVDNDMRILDYRLTSGILARGGTILGTSRIVPPLEKRRVKIIAENFKRSGMDALIAVGGEDTLKIAQAVHKAHSVPIVGVPKSIDNSLSGTDYTFGFDTAVNVATECIDRLHTTAESHHRIVVVEVMGRYTGWIALEAGIAGGADLMLIPEYPVEIDEAEKAVQDVIDDLPVDISQSGADSFGSAQVDPTPLRDEKKPDLASQVAAGIGPKLEELQTSQTWGTLSKVGGQISTSLRKFWHGLLGLISRTLPDDQVLDLPSWTLSLIAILVPLLMVIIGSLFYIRRGRNHLYEDHLSQAETLLALAQTQLDSPDYYQTISTAMDEILQARSYQETEEVEQLFSSLRLELDSLDRITRLEYLPLFGRGIGYAPVGQCCYHRDKR